MNRDEIAGLKSAVEREHRSPATFRTTERVRETVNGTPLTQLSVDTVEFNVPMDDAMFRIPK